MGKKARKRPDQLGRKLREIRDSFGLSQELMLAKLGFSKDDRNNLSNYETDKREAPSELVVAYAKAVRVNVEVLLDDKRELPKAVRAAAARHNKEKTQARTSK
jgi:transcriptional regulator with XRE-family HTH domain